MTLHIMTATTLDASDTHVSEDQGAGPVLEKITRPRPPKKPSAAAAGSISEPHSQPETPVSAESKAAPEQATAPLDVTHTIPPRAPGTGKRRRKNKKPQADRLPAAENRTPSPSTTDWQALTASALQYNDRADCYYQITTICETDRPYVILKRKQLTEMQQEEFDDSRVTDAVMRGERPPSVDEHWKKYLRNEIKIVQQEIPIANLWVTDTPPEKKHVVHWGEKPQQAVNVDKDSQEFFLRKEQSMKKQSQHKYKKPHKPGGYK